ncbi:hypothetical protein R5L37_00005, partial [Acinetobacter pittii]|nr:hypothetical protein [Acinetobacter pittii]
TINESSVVCGPIGCTVDFRCRLIHLKIILWNKPLEIGLCNKADLPLKVKWINFQYSKDNFESKELVCYLDDFVEVLKKYSSLEISC